MAPRAGGGPPRGPPRLDQPRDTAARELVSGEHRPLQCTRAGRPRLRHSPTPPPARTLRPSRRASPPPPSVSLVPASDGQSVSRPSRQSESALACCPTTRWTAFRGRPQLIRQSVPRRSEWRVSRHPMNLRQGLSTSPMPPRRRRRPNAGHTCAQSGRVSNQLPNALGLSRTRGASGHHLVKTEFYREPLWAPGGSTSVPPVDSRAPRSPIGDQDHSRRVARKSPSSDLEAGRTSHRHCRSTNVFAGRHQFMTANVDRCVRRILAAHRDRPLLRLYACVDSGVMDSQRGRRRLAEVPTTRRPRPCRARQHRQTAPWGPATGQHPAHHTPSARRSAPRRAFERVPRRDRIDDPHEMSSPSSCARRSPAASRFWPSSISPRNGCRRTAASRSRPRSVAA